MTRNEKAVANLEEKDIQSKIENGTVYVIIGFSELELSEFEITFQADEFDERKKEESLDK